VSGNLIEGSRMYAILVSPEYWWLEAGSSSNVEIRDNKIVNCLGVPILVQATGGKVGIASAERTTILPIKGNHLTGCSMPGILVTSTSGLTIKGNTFVASVVTNEIPGLMREAGMKELKPVVTIQCGR
jgi:parallel beta-helix repeat protein